MLCSKNACRNEENPFQLETPPKLHVYPMTAWTETKAPLVLVLLTSFFLRLGNPRFIYWTNEGDDRIQRARIGVWVPEDVALNAVFLETLDVDDGTKTLYWGERVNLARVVHNISLDNIPPPDASGGDTFFNTLDNPRGIALDSTNQVMLYTMTGASGVNNGVYEFDVVTRISTPLQIYSGESLRHCAVDPIRQNVYYTITTINEVRRISYTGSNEIVVSAGRFIFGVAFDSVNDYLYATVRDMDEVVRFNYDGASFVVLYNATDGVGSAPRGIDYDPLSNSIYWAATNDDVYVSQQ